VKLKTSELQGETLDLVVAHCVEWSKKFPIFTDGKPMSKGNYTTDWALAGPIIEREKIILDIWGDEWLATRIEDPAISEAIGPTPLIAAMRCYVASKLGDEVEEEDEDESST
jgi:hypothetical protein